MAKISGYIKHGSGIPLGGIGAGTVEIHEDGLFYDWHIFNTGYWTRRDLQGNWVPDTSTYLNTCRANRSSYEMMNADDLVFMIRTQDEDGNTPKVRTLALKEELDNPYFMPWNKCVESIEYTGEFPVARLKYNDKELPVEVTAEIFSSFIPHDSKNSGLPGFYIKFSVKNKTNRTQSVSIMGTMKNSGSGKIKNSVLKNEVIKEKNKLYIMLQSNTDSCSSPLNGNMTFFTAGDDVTYISQAPRNSRTGIVRGTSFSGSYGHTYATYLNYFREYGKLQDLNNDYEKLIDKDINITGMQLEEKYILLRELCQDALIYEEHRRLKEFDSQIFGKEENLNQFLEFAIDQFRFNIKENEWDTVLCNKSSVQPNENEEILFSLSWYYPNHISPENEKIGHIYENWFKDSLDVNRYMVENLYELYNRTINFKDALYNSTFDYTIIDSINAQLSTLIKSSWWTKDGKFGIWEGYGAVGFHTTDVSYQGSFSILALFPELQMIQMKYGAKFQREDGRVHHTFSDGFSKVDEEAYVRVDMNSQFVLMVCRDYLWTNDKGYLEGLWDNIVRAIENTKQLDGDGDGLPDHDCKHQTYDGWDYKGSPSYVDCLWLSALRAGIMLAAEIGDITYVDEWKNILDKGMESFNNKMWNGEYYVLWKDMNTGEADECCMTAQLSGQWYLGFLGLDPVVSDEKRLKVLKSIYEYNFSKENGLINASTPKGRKTSLKTFWNLQAANPWSGVEYAIASMMINEGMVNEAIEIINNVYDRYVRCGRIWNHFECGEHYYRAMSSWTILDAMQGLTWNAVKGEIKFNPMINRKDFRSVFVLPGSWGIFTQKHTANKEVIKIEILQGNVLLSKVNLKPKLLQNWFGDCCEVKECIVHVNYNNTALSCMTIENKKEGLIEIEFQDKLVLKEEDSINIVIDADKK